MNKLFTSSAYPSIATTIEYTRAGAGGVVEVSGDSELRKELIERVTKHQEHIELRTTAVVYAQGGDFEHRDRRRFTFEALQGYARTAPRTPLLTGHRRNSENKVGYCESSKAVKDGEIIRVEETLICNAPQSVLEVLRGPVNYSIGWSCDW
ncbi:MAG: hypothetical protein AAGC55_31590, partial [Myxococcota bacterium]